MTLVASSENSGLNPMSFSDLQGSTVFERLRYQRETGRFCDVALLVREKQFSAHRNILASCSPYFDSIFKYSKITKEQVTVNCPNPIIFENFLNYMYSGCVVIDRSSVSELLRLANNFLIVKLKNYCAEYLDRYLDAANCLSIRALALRYNLPTLLKAASDYFDVNINRCLLESTDIVSYSYPQLFKLINDPKYSDVITADTHLKLVVRWVGEEISTRELSFRQLLEHCTFNEVSADTLEFLLDYSPLLGKSPPSRFLLLHVMNENNMMMEKYSTQLLTLRQQVGELPPLHDPMAYEEEDGSSDDMEEDDQDFTVEGHPTAAQIIEADNEGTPKIKMKINMALATLERKRFKKPRLIPKQKKKIARDNLPQENEMIPMVDDDEIDGVYATSSLDGAHTYGPIDRFDPDEADDCEDVPDENGQFICIYCGFQSATDDGLEKHRARAHNRNHFYCCQLCEFETNWSKEFYSHCQEHWTEMPYRCETCQFSTANSIQEFLSHRLTHSEERYFKCGECAWKGRTRSQLFAHERMHSVLDDRPLHCEECGRGFQTHAALDQHVSTHNEPRQFICEDCGFASKSSENLAIHRRQHTGDVFYCHIAGCDYSSTKKSQLAAHLRTHMAVRAHMCKVCGRGFIEKSHLVRHERIHLEDKPFKCHTCDYASSRRDKLKEHILKHHNGQSTAKAQRRRYKRQRMLAAAANIVQNQSMQAKIPQDSLFRPIPVDESVSRWAQDNDFSVQAYSPRQTEFSQSMSNQQQQQQQQSIQQPRPTLQMHPQSSQSTQPHLQSLQSLQQQQQQPQTSYSPPRAYSVTNPTIPHQSTMSPGCMSMMNLPLREVVGDQQMDMVHGGPSSSRVGIPNQHEGLITPTARSPHNRSADPFGGLNTPTDLHNRPMSLPTYGQMDLQQQQQQQQQQNMLHQLPPQQQDHQWW